MTLDEIKQAVLSGKKVHWANELYDVRHANDQWLIVCKSNDNCVGLTHKDGVTMNGRPDQFFIAAS